MNHNWQNVLDMPHGSHQLLAEYGCSGCEETASIVLDTLDTPAGARGPHPGLPQGFCAGMAADAVEAAHKAIRTAFPKGREVVVVRDGVWLATHDGRFIALGRTLRDARELATSEAQEHRRRAIRRQIERVY